MDSMQLFYMLKRVAESFPLCRRNLQPKPFSPQQMEAKRVPFISRPMLQNADSENSRVSSTLDGIGQLRNLRIRESQFGFGLDGACLLFLGRSSQVLHLFGAKVSKVFQPRNFRL